MESPAGERDFRTNPATAADFYGPGFVGFDPETHAPIVKPVKLEGEALRRVQETVERWERDYPAYEELDDEGQRVADELMVRKFRERGV